MSSAKRFPATAPAPASRCTSATLLNSSDGATTTPCASSIRCFTPASSATQTPCGEAEDDTAPSPSPKEPTAAPTLLSHVAGEGFPSRVTDIATDIIAASDQPTVHASFRDAVGALGASSAMFVSFVRNDHHLAACRFMLACDAAWARSYVCDGHFECDPWLAYAAQHSEPKVASTLKLVDADHLRVQALAARAGFASALIVPAHSGAGHSRISVLCLGSSSAGYFEGAGLPRLRVNARMLALELHEWWLSRIRRELVVKARITADDLVLLQHQCQGHSSKKIAAELKVSKTSINSRFQRMNAKLGVGTRRMAVQLAIECGLILK